MSMSQHTLKGSKAAETMSGMLVELRWETSVPLTPALAQASFPHPQLGNFRTFQVCKALVSGAQGSTI